MKVVAVVGSLRKGNTAKMVSAACSRFDPTDVHVIDLSELSLNFCTGCLICDTENKCCIDDGMSTLMDRIAEADGFIFASPVRWSLMSGELKTFFDRLNPFAATETLCGKKAILFVVGQSEENGDGAFSIRAGMKSMEFFCENAGIDVIDTVEAFGCLSECDIDNTVYLERCRAAADKLKACLQ